MKRNSIQPMPEDLTGYLPYRGAVRRVMEYGTRDELIVASLTGEMPNDPRNQFSVAMDRATAEAVLPFPPGFLPIVHAMVKIEAVLPYRPPRPTSEATTVCVYFSDAPNQLVVTEIQREELAVA